tara:strand:- start:530 stop:820 length:291 start_codon:yes stop_codon:yes gene_type:complete
MMTGCLEVNYTPLQPGQYNIKVIDPTSKKVLVEKSINATGTVKDPRKSNNTGGPASNASGVGAPAPPPLSALETVTELQQEEEYEEDDIEVQKDFF